MESLQAGLDLKGKKVAVVVARWNELVTKALAEGAVDTLTSLGADVKVVSVPGAWEVPVAVAALLKKQDICGVVALGCILQGATTHAGMLAGDVSGALMGLQVSTGKPITWGILTPENQDQALERAGMKLGNKGREAALALAEVINLSAEIAQL